MKNYEFILPNVLPSEYEQLKKRMQATISDNRNKEKEFSIRYNEERFMVGIFIGNKLIFESSDIENKSEELIVRNMYSMALESLAKIKLPEEKWIK